MCTQDRGVECVYSDARRGRLRLLTVSWVNRKLKHGGISPESHGSLGLRTLA